MNPWAILAIVCAFGLVLAAAGVQTYRLQGAQNQIALMEQDKENARENEKHRQLALAANTQRTNNEDRAARARAASSIVRVESTPGTTGTAPVAGGGDQSTVCYDRGKLDKELAGFAERLAERLTRVAKQGEEVAAAYRGCRVWAEGLTTASGYRPPHDAGHGVVGALGQLPP